MPERLGYEMTDTVMPKATAVWLIDNTTLTFVQIAEFCNLHELEVQAIADGEVAVNIVGQNPVTTNQLTAEEITRCEKDPKASLKALASDIPEVSRKVKGPRYVSVTKRADKPDAIAWMVKHHPQMPDSAVCKLIGTTKGTLESIRSKSHWNTANISPQSPVQLGICTLADLQAMVKKYPKPEVDEKEDAAADNKENSSFDLSAF